MNKHLTDRLTDAILYIVDSKGAIKSVDLAIAVVQLMHPIEYDSKDYLEMLKELVGGDKLVEIEYILPNMPDRVKSVYFPVGTITRR